jgi:hypothetical protein
MEAVGLALALVLAVVGWVVERISARSAMRRDRVVSFLIDAYRVIDNSAHRPGGMDSRALEKAISDIQLFGDAKLINLADKFARDFASRNADVAPLLEALRSSLRDELRLAKVKERDVWLRIE